MVCAEPNTSRGGKSELSVRHLQQLKHHAAVKNLGRTSPWAQIADQTSLMRRQMHQFSAGMLKTVNDDV